MLLYQKKPNKYITHVYNTLPLEQWDPFIKEKYCFYYNWCDHVYDITFSNCLDHKHISFLRSNPNVKVIYDFNGEPIVSSVLEDIIKVAADWSLNPNQIVLIVSNELQTQYVNQHLTDNTIITKEYCCDIKNLVMAPSRSDIPFKKFSTMCRLHRPWRSYIICRLKDKGILDNFHYSFVGCYHDMDDVIEKALKENMDITKILNTGDWKIIVDSSRIKRDLENCYGRAISKEISNFVDSCPHYIEKDNFQTDVETPQELLASGIHLIIENGFFDIEESIHTTRSVELGEKTWKAIMTHKPFLVYSDTNYLKNLKLLGFKTFSQYINEEYDNEKDPKRRAEMILDEIERINNLPIEKFNKLLANCKTITEHNFQLFQSIREKTPDFLEIDFTKI